MVDNDTLTYHVREPSQIQEKTIDQSLITQERTQKLDLLMHLLANLTQQLVVCGPKGIGKTTLLYVLQERNASQWVYCQIVATSELSFEKILEQIDLVLNHGKPKSDRSLSAAFDQIERQNKKIILIVDDAGDLVPGLITTLIQYAVGNPVIRLIFVLTHDDIYLKNRTDRVIDDCHFIEIPPLSENQCGTFLHHLATKPFSQIAFNSINDNLIASIYRETHGIPGRIISTLPGLSISKRIQNPTILLVLAVAMLVAAALAVQWLSASNVAEKEKQQVVAVANNKVDDKPTDLASNLSQPVFLNEQIAQETKEQNLPEWQVSKASEISQKSDDMVNNHDSAEPLNLANKSTDVATDLKQEKSLPSENKPPIDFSKKDQLKGVEQSSLKPIEAGLDAGSDEEAPLSAADFNDNSNGPAEVQSPESFTLQIMVLTKEQAAKDVIKKHQSLGRALTYVKTITGNGREKFILLYGSYASAELANKAKHSLPPEFRQSYARKLGSIKLAAPIR
jgi:DamX protein